MEYPGIGEHCSLSTCNKLDFLPFKCTACGNTYCDDHWQQDNHSCSAETFEDRRSFSCPLCDAVITPKAGENPNISMEAHIAAGCRREKKGKKAKKASPNTCHARGCKTKEVVPILCDQCHVNFCLKHRHPDDHGCTRGKTASRAHASTKHGNNSTSARMPSSAAERNRAKSKQSVNSGGSRHSRTSSNHPSQRQQSFTPRPRPTQNINAGLSPEEALQMAIAQSSSSTSTTSSTIARAPVGSQARQQGQIGDLTEEELLQIAIAESMKDAQPVQGERQRRTSGQRRGDNDKKTSDGCAIS